MLYSDTSQCKEALSQLKSNLRQDLISFQLEFRGPGQGMGGQWSAAAQVFF